MDINRRRDNTYNQKKEVREKTYKKRSTIDEGESFSFFGSAFYQFPDRLNQIIALRPSVC